MYKKIIRFFTFLLFAFFISSGMAKANLASVNNVHDTILIEKGITVSIDAGIDNTALTSMKYLLEQIDKANEILNGYATTSYGTGINAVSNPVGVSKVLTDVDELIVKLPYFIWTVESVSSFDFQISASGNFTIDWGDGNVDTINKTDQT